MITRLEAFVDLLRRRKQRRTLSSHGLRATAE
jgi:hypothetical protein